MRGAWDQVQRVGLFVAPSGVVAGHWDEILEFAAAHRLPAIYAIRSWVDRGALMAYTPNLAESVHRTAWYVDRILKGARPAELPVERPTRYEQAIKLKTAKVLRLTIPPSVLLRADEILE